VHCKKQFPPRFPQATFPPLLAPPHSRIPGAGGSFGVKTAFLGTDRVSRNGPSLFLRERPSSPRLSGVFSEFSSNRDYFHLCPFISRVRTFMATTEHFCLSFCSMTSIGKPVERIKQPPHSMVCIKKRPWWVPSHPCAWVGGFGCTFPSSPGAWMYPTSHRTGPYLENCIFQGHRLQHTTRRLTCGYGMIWSCGLGVQAPRRFHYAQMMARIGPPHFRRGLSPSPIHSMVPPRSLFCFPHLILLLCSLPSCPCAPNLPPK